MAIIEFFDFHFTYPQGSIKALKNISFSVEEGSFTVLFGNSGSGKSTLLRCMKKEICPKGVQEGEICTTLSRDEIAIVFQDPNTQLVCNTVYEDLVFHMENLGYEQNQMRKRLAETVQYFGLAHLMDVDTTALSGGQKQLLVLCSAMMTRPKLLILDEPSAQLDPIATREFYGMLSKINEDFGVTVVVSEHKLDDLLGMADFLVYLENGHIAHWGNTKDVIKKCIEEERIIALPAVPRLCYYLKTPDVYLTPKVFKQQFQQSVKISPIVETIRETPKLLSIQQLFYTYEPSAPFVLKNLKMNVGQKERVALLGGNGSGKSTLLQLLAGLRKPHFGKIKMDGLRKIFYIPQDLKLFFSCTTVLEEIQKHHPWDEEAKALVQQFKMAEFLERHPYDLSGGEASKLSLMCGILRNPDLLLLDEPTKGLDSYAKQVVEQYLALFRGTIIMATHDLECACRFATRCMLLFDGAVVSAETPRAFFADNEYFTTPANVAMRHCNNTIFLPEDVKNHAIQG